jgi:fibulin 1/2
MCDAGFQYNFNNEQCEDLNECALNRDSCTSAQTCENTIGSYHCRRQTGCGTGYTFDVGSQRCLDDDECRLGIHNCGPARECHNTEGSFRCVDRDCGPGYKLDYLTGACEIVICPRGMKADRGGNCIDINECAENRAACRPNQECRNTVGSYTCRNLVSCGAGFALSEDGARCQDVNECEQGGHDCTGHMMQCINRPGTYLCQCPEGYSMDREAMTCNDIDECTRYRGQVCALNAECQNSQGSYYCLCKDGFRKEEDTNVCKDIDECERPGMCQHNCRNTWGSYQCTCHEGYQLAADGRVCDDIDECAIWAERGGAPLCLGICENTFGSYRCQCPNGYNMAGDGRTCQDVDECALRTANCLGEDDLCINTRGGYKCEQVECPKGFVKAPSLGNRNNNVRCQRQTFVCPQGDTECLYAPLSISFNFITIPSKIRVPADLFTMRGPLARHRRLEFELKMREAVNPVTGATSPVTLDYFRVQKVKDNEAIVTLLQEITGPQDVELQLDMNIFSREFREDQEEIFFGTAVAVFKVFVSEDPW